MNDGIYSSACSASGEIQAQCKHSANKPATATPPAGPKHTRPGQRRGLPDELVEVLVPKVGGLVREVAAHSQDDVAAVVELGLGLGVVEEVCGLFGASSNYD